MPARTRLLWLVAGVLTAMSCSSMGGMGMGCAALQPIPSGRYTGPKTDNAVNLRLSPQGLQFLNQPQNWQALVEMFAPGRTLRVPVSCIAQNFPLAIGGLGPPVNTGVFIADQGNGTTGRNDGACNTNDLPAEVVATITGFSLTTNPTDSALVGNVSLQIDTGKLFVTIDTPLCDLACSLRFDSARGAQQTNTLDATVKFTIDQRWDRLLSFDISQVNGTQICGSVGAPGAPRCIDPGDLVLNREAGICGYACEVLDIALVKNFVLGLFSPVLQRQLQGILANQRCEPCGVGLPACPTSGSATSVCQDGICKDAADNTKCAPRFLGLEGRLNLGATLGRFGAPPDAQLDLSFAAGSSVTVDQGLSFGTRAGLKAVSVAPCVTPMPAPPVFNVAAPNFDFEAPTRTFPDGGTTRAYHAAVGLSSQFLNLAFHEAHQAGALCLQLDTNNVGLLSTGLFATLLPSLGTLAVRDGKHAPMMVALRPARPPTIAVGEGTVDPVTKRPLKPLLELNLVDLSIDFFALIDDRFVRLFTLTADIALPLSLTFEGCDTVTPAIGDVRMLITNVRTSNNELLAEDPRVLEQLIPAVIGLAEPALANALTGFSLPAFGAFKLRVTGVKGLGNFSGTETYNHVGLFAELLPAMAQCAVLAPLTTASLRASEVPTAAQMKIVPGRALTWPAAVLDVGATGVPGTLEFSTRVDDGLWTGFSPSADGTVRVAHPRLLIQGHHTLWVRSRTAENPNGVSAPVAVPFTVDWDAPVVRARRDRASDLLEIEAHDVITADDDLRFAYAVGDEPVSSFGLQRPISLSAVEARGVRVLVRDLSGNVGETRFEAKQLRELREVEVPKVASELPASAGCAVAPVSALWLLGLVLARRRS